MFPHERSLVKKLEGKPFALIGIDSDPTVAVLKQAIEKEHLTWRHFFDGGTDGPIATKWNVHGWPTIYILDAKGVIRYRDLRDEAMEKAVEKLLAEMKPEKTASRSDSK